MKYFQCGISFWLVTQLICMDPGNKARHYVCKASSWPAELPSQAWATSFPFESLLHCFCRILYGWLFCLHVYSCTMCMHCLPLPEEGIKSPGTRWLWATIWVLGIKPRSSARAASALNHWASSSSYFALSSAHFVTWALFTKTGLWQQFQL